MLFWALLYDLVDDYLERRVPLRPAHLELARAFYDRDELLMGGALAGHPAQAILVFRAEDPSVVETFVSEDPYVQSGLITSWSIRQWNVAIGP